MAFQSRITRNKVYKVFIDGAHGTTGLKIHEYLDPREDIEILTLPEERRKDLGARVRRAEEADVSILCLPDDAARELADAVPGDVRLIDTSTAHRVDPDWVYGMAELAPDQRKRIKKANRVANPGCHATGFIALVKPLVAAGVCDPKYPFTSFCVTGYSGGGKKMIARHQSQDRPDYLKSPGQYGLPQKHKHLAEMMKMTGIAFAPSFEPIVGDFYSGMVMSVPLRRELMSRVLGPGELRDLYAEYYKDEALISVNSGWPEDGFIHGSVAEGKNNLEIFVAGNEDRPLVISRFDNLGKGASGAAVQNMNLMLGIEETKGLI